MTTPRPTRNDDAIIREAAKTLTPKVVEWCGDNPDVTKIEANLFKALRWHNDGYELARELNNYAPDAELVEILDGAWLAKRKALEIAEIAWVKESGAQSIPLETRVLWTQKPGNGIGIVTGNHPDGKSAVMFPDMGHVREGLGTRGSIVEWEKLETLPADAFEKVSEE